MKGKKRLSVSITYRERGVAQPTIDQLIDSVRRELLSAYDQVERGNEIFESDKDRIRRINFRLEKRDRPGTATGLSVKAVRKKFDAIFEQHRDHLGGSIDDVVIRVW